MEIAIGEVRYKKQKQYFRFFPPHLILLISFQPTVKIWRKLQFLPSFYLLLLFLVSLDGYFHFVVARLERKMLDLRQLKELLSF